MFSSRTNWPLTPNRLSELLRERRTRDLNGVTDQTRNQKERKHKSSGPGRAFATGCR